jgi:hypothetical protein
MPFCIDCKNKLDAVVSNTRSPNEYRIRLYICKKCSMKKQNATIISVTRKLVPESKIWEIINVDIFQTPRK